MDNETIGSKRFAITGVAGYIAPRHLKAMHTLGQRLVAAYDPCDSVGMIDGYYPRAAFTTREEEFRRLIAAEKIDYLSICTPNHLHTLHTIMGLEAGADVICEKPLALTRGELHRMEECRRATGGQVWTILQLRFHPEILRLKELVERGDPRKTYDIDLAYITPRGAWYAASWKGDTAKSGGVATNIGVHFIDMLHWIFGAAQGMAVHHTAANCMAGLLLLERARVRFFLSIDPDHRPRGEENPMTPYRKLTIDGEDFDFTAGFTDLHTESYRRILAGEGYSVADAHAAVETLETLRGTAATGLSGDCHPMAFELLHHSVNGVGIVEPQHMEAR